MSHTLGFIGLGRMGKNMVLHLVEQKINVVAYNRTREVMEEFVEHSKIEIRDSKKTNPESRITNPENKKFGTLHPAYNLKSLIQQLIPPRIIWIMVPASAKASTTAQASADKSAGKPNDAPVDEMLEQLMQNGLQKGDIVIDGGNTYYKDTVRRSRELAVKGIYLLDCGTSGGLEGARHGASLMLGGAEDVVMRLSWLWDALSAFLPDEASAKLGAKGDGEGKAWGYFGPSGAGHYVKMIHNGIEYGMDEALGEGFEMLKRGPYVLDLAKVARVWANGSVIRGWLVELLAHALDHDSKLSEFTGRVGGGETGSWAAQAAKEQKVHVPVIEQSLEARKRSQEKPTFAGKVVSALRAGYGGHAEPETRNKNNKYQ